MAELTTHRPDDAVLSEEGRDNLVRLDADRVWIVDPLDGTRDFPDPRSAEYAVHVALVTNGAVDAAAVSIPELDEVHSTDTVEYPTTTRERLVVVTNRAYSSAGYDVANALDADLVACGSAGVKAMLVVNGSVDLYVHDSALYEWDVCAPALVAQAAGLFVSDLEGEPFVFNKRRPVVRGMMICPPELAAEALAAARW
jgi:3'(2'), 5'-bisphosphate nucleotidase